MARRKNPSPCSGTDQRYVDAPLPVLEPTRLERFCRIVTPQYVRPISGSPVGPSDDIASLDHNHNVPFSVIEHPVDFLRNGAGIAPTSFHHCLQKKPFNCGLVLGETAEKAPLPASDTSRFSCPTSPRSSHDLIRPSPPRHGEDGELAKERKHDNTSASPVQTPACETATGFPIPSSVSKNFPTYEDRALAALDGVHLPVHASHHQLPFMSSMPATPSSVLFETARSSSKPSPPVSSTRVCLSPLCTNGEGTHEPYSHEEIKTQAGCVASGAHSLISSSPPPAPNAAKSKVPDTSARASNLPPHSSSIEAAKEEHRKPMHQEKDRIDLPSESESGLEYGRFVSSTENKQDSTTRIDNAKERTNAVGLEALQGVSSGIHSVTSTACVQVRCRDSHYALNIRPSESFPGVDVAAGCVNSHGTSKKEVEKEPFASPSQPTSICVKGDISSPSSLPLPAEGSSAKCCEMSPSPQGHQDIAVRIEENLSAISAAVSEQTENWEARTNLSWRGVDSFRSRSCGQPPDIGDLVEANKLVGSEAASSSTATLEWNKGRSLTSDEPPSTPTCVSATARISPVSILTNVQKKESENTLLPGQLPGTAAATTASSSCVPQVSISCDLDTTVEASQARNRQAFGFENSGIRDQLEGDRHKRDICLSTLQRQERNVALADGSSRTSSSLSSQFGSQGDDTELSTPTVLAHCKGYGPFISQEDHSCRKLPATGPSPTRTDIADQLAFHHVECSPESCSAENACLLGEKVPPAQRIYSRKNEHLPHVEEVVNQLVVSSPSRTSFSGLSFHRNVFASISQQVEQHQVLLAAKQHDSVGGRTAHQARTTANLKTIHLHAVPAFQPEMSNQSGEGEQRDTLPDHQQQRTPHRSPADVDGKPRSPGSTHPGASGLLEQSQAGCEMPSTSDDSGGIKEARIPTFVTAMLPTGIPTRVQREPTVGCPPEDVKSSVAVQLERKEAYSLSRTSAVSHLPRQRVPNPDTAFCNFKEKTCISYTLDPLVALSPASDSHPTPLSNKSANSPASTNACVSLIQSSSSSIPEPMPSSLSSPLQPLELPLASRPKNSAACWPSRDSESASCDFPGSGEVSRLCSSGKMPEIASPNRAASGTAQRQICEDQRDVGLHVASTPVDHDAKTRCRPGTSLTDWLSRLPVSEADAKRIAVSVGDFIERKASRQRAGSLPSDTPPDQCGTLEAVPDSGEDGQANCSLTEEDLDLHLVAGDVSRQRWINHFPVSKSEGKESQKQKDSMVELVTDAVSIFCTMNGVCYWQGMHDLCSAFLFLSPRPSLSQLVQLLQAFLLLFAPWLLLPPKESIEQSANAARLFRQLLQFFSPSVTNEVERLIPSVAWSQTILIHTLGFSRFKDVHTLLGLWRCILELRAPEDKAPPGYFYFLLAYFELHKEELRISPELIINSDVSFDHSSFSDKPCPACCGADASSHNCTSTQLDETLQPLTWQRPFPLRYMLHRMLTLYSLTPPAALLDLQSFLTTCSSLARSPLQRHPVRPVSPLPLASPLLGRDRSEKDDCKTAQIPTPPADGQHSLTVGSQARCLKEESVARTTSLLSGLQSSLCLSLDPCDLLAELGDPRVFQRPAFLNSVLSEWLASPVSDELQPLSDDQHFHEILSRIQGKMPIIGPRQASTCASSLGTVLPQEFPSVKALCPPRIASATNDTLPSKNRDITAVVPSFREAPPSFQMPPDGPTATSAGGTLMNAESEHHTGDVWTSELLEVHFVDLRPNSARQRGPTLQKLLGLQPSRLPGGAKYHVVSVATSSGLQEASRSSECRIGLEEPQDSRDSSVVRRGRVTRSTKGASRSATRSSSIRSRRLNGYSLIQSTNAVRRNSGRTPSGAGTACRARRQSVNACEKTGQSPGRGEEKTQSMLSPSRSVMVTGQGAWLMRRRRQRGVSRTRTAQRLSAGKEVARTEKPAAQACDRDEPAENHLSLDELIDGIHSMKKTASNVMRVWLLIPNEGSMNESLLEKGLLHPEASRSEMSAFQEAYFRLTSAGTEGVLVLNGGFVALEKAMVRAAASYRYTAMDVTHVNSSPSSASVSEWAVLPRASVLSPHPVDAVGIQPGAGLHPVDRPAEKMVMSPKADAQGQLLLPLRRIQKLQRRRRKIRSCALESRASVDTDALLSTTRAFALRDVGQAIATWLFPTKELSETANIHERQGKDHLQVWCPESRRPLQLADINKVITSSQKQQAHQRMPLSISSSGSSSRCDSSSDGTTFLKQAKTVANTTCFVPVCPISSGPHQQLWDFRVPEAHSPSHPPALGSGHPVALSLRQPHLQAPAKGSVATSFDVAAGALLPPSACSEPGRPPHRLVSPMPRCDRGLVQMQGVAPSGSFTRAHLSGSFLVGCAEAAAVQANIVSTSKAPYHTNRDSATNGTTLSKDISTVVNKSYHARMQVAPSLKDGATYNGWTDTSMSPKYSASAPKQKKASIPATLHQEPNSLATTTPTVHLPFV